MRKWNVPLTYSPKIDAVKRGDCTQTIRTGTKFEVGDLIRFYVWEGKPYRSKRTTITEYMPIIEPIFNIKIYPDHISVLEGDMRDFLGYRWKELDNLAKKDGVVPPTGETLRDTLIEKNGRIPANGIAAQIIRWKS